MIQARSGAHDERFEEIADRRSKGRVHHYTEGLMPRYGNGAQKSVERAMHKRKAGTLHSGRSHQTVKSRQQAIAIGLSEAREKGAKVPSRSSSSRRGHGSS